MSQRPTEKQRAAGRKVREAYRTLLENSAAAEDVDIHDRRAIAAYVAKALRAEADVVEMYAGIKYLDLRQGAWVYNEEQAS